MFTLGIETSCDETSAAVLDDKLKILSNVVLSQDEIHAPYGGVVPELASRQHIVSIGYVVRESLHRAGLSLQDIGVYSVTQGPGLIGSLLVGLSFAKGLAFFFGKPLIPVDHLEAHIHSVFLENKKVPFPCLALLVSGGHTSLFLLEKKFHHQLLGRTRDDAAGEALDKIAKHLELGYPGGPVIDEMAEKGNPERFDFALPRMTDQSMDYSFSGLKTAALRIIKQNRISKSEPQFFDFLASFEHAVIRALLANIERAAEKFNPGALILCGGVARNRKLRKKFQALGRKNGIPCFIPSPDLCTDNAAMVAALAVEKIRVPGEVSLSLDLNAYPRL
jgi:N6-L-threonylcarbamoyladenine synthase